MRTTHLTRPVSFMKPIVRLLIGSSLLVNAQHLLAQSQPMLPSQPMPLSQPMPPSQPVSQTYPQVKAYLSFIIPVLTINKDATTPNFKYTTTIGFPVGINVYYSEKFAFSYEFTPSIVAQKSPGKPGTSKTSNLLFDPGPMFRFKHGFNIIARLAFETAGRYGFTPVFNQVYLRTKAVNYFVALSLPTRFGNSMPASVGANVQFGFTFN
jgi:hypothetical protein